MSSLQHHLILMLGYNMTHKTIIDYLSILSCVCATGKQKQKGIEPFEEK